MRLTSVALVALVSSLGPPPRAAGAPMPIPQPGALAGLQVGVPASAASPTVTAALSESLLQPTVILGPMVAPSAPADLGGGLAVGVPRSSPVAGGSASLAVPTGPDDFVPPVATPAAGMTASTGISALAAGESSTAAPAATLTATEVVTVTITATAAPSTTAASAHASTTPTASPTAWTLASALNRDNLASQLGVTTWEWGKDNTAVATAIPARHWSPSILDAVESTLLDAVAPLTDALSLVASLTDHTSASSVLDDVDLTNSTSLAVTFPPNSINPANPSHPQGGTGMYLTPLPLATASTVSLAYSVFFPASFAFVKGGKLPGLYGGRPGCSGGHNSGQCFSTRLMWRAGGAGEMYLYVPGGQPAALCDGAEECEGEGGEYGLSVGRGSWTFARGGWTSVRQEVRLGTAGRADGGFKVWVNGELVLEEEEVMFRAAVEGTAVASAGVAGGAGLKDAGAGAGKKGEAEPEGVAKAQSTKAKTTTRSKSSPKSTTTKNKTTAKTQAKSTTKSKPRTTSKTRAATTHKSTANAKSTTKRRTTTKPKLATKPTAKLSAAKSSKPTEPGGLLGSLLGGVVHRDHKRGDGAGLPLADVAWNALPTATWTPPTIASTTHHVPPGTITVTETVYSSPTLATANADADAGANAVSPSTADDATGLSGLLGSIRIATPKAPAEPVTFTGIMFDTFFGGNTPDYASPTEQVIYFNRVSLDIID